MMAWINENLHWVWLSAGLVLMILEIFGASGYLLASGMAASLVALVTYFAPELLLKWQLLVFGGAVVVMAAAVTYWFRKIDRSSQGVDVGKPGSDLIGKTIQLTAPIAGYQGRVRVQDANWEVSCNAEALNTGDRVRVLDVKGRTLVVEAI